MSQTIGQTLQKEREQRGLSIADVAHDTRIHVDTIRGLEADDYSVFSSTTYARSFLQLYSRHLEVDADAALQDFDSVAENLSNGGFSYLESVTDAIEAGETIHTHSDDNRVSSYGEKHKQPLPLFLTVVVLLLLVMIPAFYFIGQKANSLEEAASILKETIVPKGEALSENHDQQDSKGNPSTLENVQQVATKSITSANDPQAAPDEPPPLNDLSRHRFPRPLPESKPSPSTIQLKAIPVEPKKKSTEANTAQNRN